MKRVLIAITLIAFTTAVFADDFVGKQDLDKLYGCWRYLGQVAYDADGVILYTREVKVLTVLELFQGGYIGKSDANGDGIFQDQ